jgi:hypothetical protein
VDGRDVGDGIAQLTGLRRRVRRLRARRHRRDQCGGQLVDRRGTAGADVEHPPATVGSFGKFISSLRRHILTLCAVGLLAVMAANSEQPIITATSLENTSCSLAMQYGDMFVAADGKGSVTGGGSYGTKWAPSARWPLNASIGPSKPLIFGRDGGVVVTFVSS